MLTPNANMKIFLCTGYTDMRKGVNSLSILASGLPGLELNNVIFVFRGKRADRLKILWWDGQVASRSTQNTHYNVCML
jgi:transposase